MQAYQVLLATGHTYRDLDPLGMNEIIDLANLCEEGRMRLAKLDLIAHYEALKGK